MLGPQVGEVQGDRAQREGAGGGGGVRCQDGMIVGAKYMFWLFWKLTQGSTNYQHYLLEAETTDLLEADTQFRIIKPAIG